MQELQHFTVPRFWRAYDELPQEIRYRADKQFQLLKENPRHPSVQFKKIRVKDGVELWSARVTQGYRALAVRRPNDFLWFWIGSHKNYDSLIG
jgi:mRNA-degrading endonuclease RelE of RelBE toxin-antitoxin system